MQMEALQQQWDNTSSALEVLQQEDKRCKKHIGRLQQQAEVRCSAVFACSMDPCAQRVLPALEPGT
jgi:hypothetical protein